jgi:Tfp pilus assembly protein PilF
VSDTLADLARTRTALASRLTGSLTTAERLQLKDDIVALFHRSEAAIAELQRFKESIRPLIDQFKALPPPTDPVSARHDHIGATTAAERGWSALAGGDWVAAEASLREAVQRDPQFVDAHALLGWALMHQGRDDEALQRCLQVLVREPEHGLARTAIGAICVRKGITGEAIEHLSRVVKSASDPRASLYANYWLGVAYLRRDMLAAAVDVLTRAVTAGPNLAEGWAELGRAEWLAGDRERAFAAWHTGRAVRHSPFAARAAALLGAAEAGEPILRSPLD